MTTSKNKFRPEFCDPLFYQKNQDQFKIIEHFVQPLSSSQQIVTWVICCACLRRPKNWLAQQNTSSDDHLSQKDNILLHPLFKAIGLYWPQKISPQITLIEFSQNIKIKSLPEIAHKSLFHFLNDRYQLKIIDHEPTPHELLNLQIQNQRVLTFNPNFKSWPDLKYGNRDPLSFWIHDLIHAEHFFSSNENRLGQIGFYSFAQIILDYKILDELLLNAEFNSAFSYLISDMNSHPVHLIKTLKAIIDIHSSDNENIWTQISNRSVLNNQPEIKAIFNLINTADFTTEHAEKLTLFFKQLKVFSPLFDDHFDFQ